MLEGTKYLAEVIYAGALLIVNTETTNEFCGNSCNLTCNNPKCREDW